MTEHDNTEDKKEKQAALVASLEAAQAAQPVPVSKPLAFTSEDNLPPREYDQTRINEFLDAVFHAEMDEDEHILTWRRKPLTGGMGYPKSDEDTENFVQTSKKAMSLYFGTSNTSVDAVDICVMRLHSCAGHWHSRWPITLTRPTQVHT